MFLSGKITEDSLIYPNKFENEDMTIAISELKEDEVELLTTMIDTLDDEKDEMTYNEYCELKEIDDSFMIDVFCSEYARNYSADEIKEKKDFISELYYKALDSVYKGSKVYNTYLEKKN